MHHHYCEYTETLPALGRITQTHFHLFVNNLKCSDIWEVLILLNLKSYTGHLKCTRIFRLERDPCSREIQHKSEGLVGEWQGGRERGNKTLLEHKSHISKLGQPPSLSFPLQVVTCWNAVEWKETREHCCSQIKSSQFLSDSQIIENCLEWDRTDKNVRKVQLDKVQILLLGKCRLLAANWTD